MRLVRLATSSGPGFGVVEGDEVHLVDGSPFGAGGALGRSRTGERVALVSARLLVPTTPSKIYGVGRNYGAHAAEMGLEVGAEPAVFLKPPSSLLAPGGAVVLPDPALSVEVEHEAELAVVEERRVEDGRAQAYPVGDRGDMRQGDDRIEDRAVGRRRFDPDRTEQSLEGPERGVAEALCAPRQVLHGGRVRPGARDGQP